MLNLFCNYKSVGKQYHNRLCFVPAYAFELFEFYYVFNTNNMIITVLGNDWLDEFIPK